MSFVLDQIRRIDSQLDRLQLSVLSSQDEQPQQRFTISEEQAKDPAVAARIDLLQSLIKSLSTTSTSKSALVSTDRIVSTLRQAELSPRSYDSTTVGESSAGYEHELEWLLLSKATVQTYGQVLDTILGQTILLSDEIWYWDDILGSYRYSGLYSLQTSPLRLWKWGNDVYAKVKARGVGLEQGWKQFYGLVQDVVRERSLANIQKRVVSQIALVNNEARRKKGKLTRMRLVNANALGVLLGESLSNESIHDDSLSSPEAGMSTQGNQHKWKGVVAKSIALMEAVLNTVSDADVTTDGFDELIASTTQDDPYYEIHEAASEAGSLSLRPADVADRLQSLLTKTMPQYSNNFKSVTRLSGRPSPLIRYWLPIAIGVLSSSTLLRIFVNRKEEIMTWVREFGQTVIDFGVNWVIEPTKTLIGTIRHDENSEISIMSKRSLEGDRESLERMVVQFAVDHPDGPTLNDSQIEQVRALVKEGDLTPVLKAYEKDMQNPVWGTIKGNLIRALLIQVQKTKVDVELAMSGIDSMLKSQELLFGLIGLTPGILITFATWRWLSTLSTNRKGMRRGSRQNELIRIQRNIDRILVSATPTDFGELSYKDHGLLLCEVHLLRQTAQAILPTREFQDFREEVDELVDIRAGLSRQQKVAERIRWAYLKWFA